MIVKPFLFVLKSFGIRLLITIATLVLMYFIAVPVLGIPLNTAFFTFFIASILYLILWFSICFFVVALQKSSSFNAIMLLSVWIVLVLVLPAALNNDLQNRFSIPESLEVAVDQRKGYHDKWDTDKEETMKKFYAHYPQFKEYTLPEGDFSWLWYYAMQQMGDDEAAEQSTALRKKLEQRNTMASFIARFIPTLHVQLSLNDLAKSGLGNQLLFLDETSKFHEKLKLHFYPKIFSEAAVSSENWEDFKVEVFNDKSTVNKLKTYLPLIVYILIFSVLGWFFMSGKLHRN